jgi:circadian clock protein KaiC
MALRDNTPSLLATGVDGLNDILRGGVPANCTYLISGTPGSGKTTLALQYLIEGARLGEPSLYVTLSESRREVELVARSHGWNLEGVTLFELIPTEINLSNDSQLTVFNPSEFELGETTQAMIAEVNRLVVRCLRLAFAPPVASGYSGGLV